MTIIFLDTSVIISENFLRSFAARAFCYAAALAGARIAIPAVVIDEVIGRFGKEFAEQLSKYQKTRRELGKLIDLPDFDASIDDHVGRYEEWLISELQNHHIEILDYPAVLLDEIAKKSYEGKKPFKQNGEGYKDYIVWKTILNGISVHDESQIFIFCTKNVSDFCETSEDGRKILHEDLCKDADGRALDLKIFTSIKDIYDSEIAPNLDSLSLDEIPSLGREEIIERAQEILEKELQSYTAFGFEGVPFRNEVTIVASGELAVDATDIRKADEAIIISVDGSIEIEVSGFIDKHAIYLAEEEDKANFYISDPDWNDWVMNVGSTVDTRVELSLFYSSHTKNIEGYSLQLPQEVEDDWGK